MLQGTTPCLYAYSQATPTMALPLQLTAQQRGLEKCPLLAVKGAAKTDNKQCSLQSRSQGTIRSEVILRACDGTGDAHARHRFGKQHMLPIAACGWQNSGCSHQLQY